jgi:carbamate kinase
MEESTARELARELGWVIEPAEGGWRRRVPSPRPLAFVELDRIARLVETGAIVIAGGGGGTPVRIDPVLGLEGVDAVIDKDRAAQVLANGLGAHTLLVLTNVEGAYIDYDSPGRRLLEQLRADEAEALLARGEFGEGSMKPKIEAAIEFVRAGGQRACIARLDRGSDAVAGHAGTTVLP